MSECLCCKTVTSASWMCPLIDNAEPGAQKRGQWLFVVKIQLKCLGIGDDWNLSHFNQICLWQWQGRESTQPARWTRKYAFLRALRRGKRVFKDSVRLSARFYSRSEYDKPFECWTNHNSHTFRSHLCLQVIRILKTIIFTATLRFINQAWKLYMLGTVCKYRTHLFSGKASVRHLTLSALISLLSPSLNGKVVALH